MHTSPVSSPGGSLGGWEGEVMASFWADRLRWPVPCRQVVPRPRTLTAVRAQAPPDRHSTEYGGRRGRWLERFRSRLKGATRRRPAHAQCVGISPARALTLPAGRLSEGDVHVPMGVDSARRETEGQTGLQGLVPE